MTICLGGPREVTQPFIFRKGRVAFQCDGWSSCDIGLSCDISVASIRERLLKLLVRADRLHHISDVDLVVPCVCHANCGLVRNRPNIVYADEILCTADLSPWCMPMPSEDFDVKNNFMRERCDLAALLRPLNRKYLYCSCTSTLSCWALFLQDMFIEVFDINLIQIYNGEGFATQII